MVRVHSEKMNSAGHRAKEKVMQNMKKRLLDEMNKSYHSNEGNDETFQRAIAQSENLIKLKYPKKQNSYDEIPVFPSGYKKDDPRDWVSKDFENDYLQSNFSKEEMDNLLMQLAHHSLDVASLIIPTSEVPLRPFKRLAVTPMSPPHVIRPQPPSLEKMKLDEESAKKAAKEAERTRSLRRFAPPDAIMPSKAPKEKKVEEVTKPGKDTYHIIRIYQHSGRRYLDLLRQDSDGYVIAWRLLFSLGEHSKAHWCFFLDFEYLRTDLPFLEMRVMAYESGYGELKHLYYGLRTLDVIIDNFLSHLYANPEGHSTHESGKTYLQILCLLFGEAPRFGAIREFIDSKLKLRLDHYECEYTPAHQLGAGLSALINDWSDTSDTAMYLILVILEEAIRESISGSSGSSIAQSIEQFDFNIEKAHERCETAMKTISKVFSLPKDQDSSGKSHKYGALALHDLIHKQLHLLKHHKELVVSIILRQGHFRRVIVLPGIKTVKKNLANKPIDSADIMFWKQFDHLFLIEKRCHLDVINFLEDAKPFLIDYGFNRIHVETYNGIDLKCNVFNVLRFTGGMSPVEAANTAWEFGVKLKDGDISMVLNFLKDHRPAATPPRWKKRLRRLNRERRKMRQRSK